MTTPTKPWPDMTTQGKNAALAEMMGWKVLASGLAAERHWRLPDGKTVYRPDFIHSYTDCFEGPVAWAKEQRWEVMVLFSNEYPATWLVGYQDGKYHQAIKGNSPDAICQAIWEAAMAMRKEEEG